MSSFWYLAISVPRRPDGTTIDIKRSPAASEAIHARIDALDTEALLDALDTARRLVSGFDPGDPPAEATRRMLHAIADEVLPAGYHRYCSHLCLEGEDFVLAGDFESEMEAQEEYYGMFAALWASPVCDDPLDASVEGPPVAYDPHLSRLDAFVDWYAGTAADALGPGLAGGIDGDELAERLRTCLKTGSAEVPAVVRAAAADEWHAGA